MSRSRLSLHDRTNIQANIVYQASFKRLRTWLLMEPEHGVMGGRRSDVSILTMPTVGLALVEYQRHRQALRPVLLYRFLQNASAPRHLPSPSVVEVYHRHR